MKLIIPTALMAASTMAVPIVDLSGKASDMVSKREASRVTRIGVVDTSAGDDVGTDWWTKRSVDGLNKRQNLGQQQQQGGGVVGDLNSILQAASGQQNDDIATALIGNANLANLPTSILGAPSAQQTSSGLQAPGQIQQPDQIEQGGQRLAPGQIQQPGQIETPGQAQTPREGQAPAEPPRTGEPTRAGEPGRPGEPRPAGEPARAEPSRPGEPPVAGTAPIPGEPQRPGEAPLPATAGAAAEPPRLAEPGLTRPSNGTVAAGLRPAGPLGSVAPRAVGGPL